MRFPSNGKAFLNLASKNLNLPDLNKPHEPHLQTKTSLIQQTKNAYDRQLLPVSYSSTKEISSHSKQLNLLPYHVLPLEETLNRFMTTVEPLLTPTELKQQMKITEEFLNGKGSELQKLLEDVGSKEKNWLADRWLNAAYLQYRSPVTVFVSPGMTFPRQNFKDVHAFVSYTSKVIFCLGEFNNIIQADKIPIVKMGNNELDNSQFGKVFGTCRIPRRSTDEIVYNPYSDYVVVIYKNHVSRIH